MGEEGSNKKYSSVVTTIGVVDKIIYDFSNKKDFLNHCQNRSVFSDKELNQFWEKHRFDLKVLKFIYVKSLTKRLTLEYLWNKEIVEAPSGPRPFTLISEQAFNQIIIDSETEVKFINK